MTVSDAEHSDEMMRLVNNAMDDHQATVQSSRVTLVPRIVQAGEMIATALRRGGKLLACGNGGSAAEAQHLVAELVGRFEADRGAFPAIALTTDTSILTAVGNDFGYRQVFARQIDALARPGDVVLVMSTSGNSENVLEAVERSRSLGAATIVMTGQSGGKVAPLADLALQVPSTKTSRIQEVHLLMIHLLCQMLDRLLHVRG